METLEQRKAKFKQHLEQAVELEEDEDMLSAIKHYREALKYSLHKKDSDHIQQKIQNLQKTAELVTGMSGESQNSGSKLPLILAGVVLLLIVAGLAAFLLLRH